MCGSEGSWFDGCKPNQVNLQEWNIFHTPAHVHVPSSAHSCLCPSPFRKPLSQMQTDKNTLTYQLCCTVFTHVNMHSCAQVCLSVCRHCVTVLSVCLDCMKRMAAHAFQVIVLPQHHTSLHVNSHVSNEHIQLTYSHTSAHTHVTPAVLTGLHFCTNI